jgi:hypothetical protein
MNSSREGVKAEAMDHTSRETMKLQKAGASGSETRADAPPRTGSQACRRGQRAAARWVALAAVSVLGALAALSRQAAAQDAEGEADLAPDLAPSGVLTERRAVELAPSDAAARGKEIVDGIERSAQSIQRQLQSARKERDVVRVLCLNDKLNQVDVALRSARDRVSLLQAAAERNDADRTRHEYTVLAVLSDRVRTLVGESSQCVGEETGFIGEAEVSVSIDPNLPDGNTGFGLETYALPAPPNISSPIE